MTAVKGLQVVHNALAVVAALAGSQPVGVSELSRATQLDKSGVQRILVTLHDAGWIRRSPTARTRWELTSLPTTLFADRSKAWLLGRAEPVLRELRDATGETSMLAVFESDELLAVASSESPHPIRMALPYLPFRVPLTLSSGGRAVLSLLPAQDARRLLGDVATDAELAVLREARRHGWATSGEEMFPDTHSVAAPLQDRDGNPIGALMVAAPAFRLRREQMPGIGRLVADAATRLTGERT